MNICLLNDSFPPVIDGVANTVMNYARILTEDLGADVTVATPRYPDADYSGYPYRVLPYPSIDTTKLIAGYRTGNSLSLREIDTIAESGPDIIHTHCPASSTLMARILQYETGAPVIFTYHTKFDVDIERAVGNGFLKKETIRAMISNISACDEVWVVSRGAGENLRSLGYEGTYRVMVNGVDFTRGKASPEAVAEATRGYDLPEGIPVFLFVGRLMKYKGLPIILDALKILSEKREDFRMVFVGEGADAEELKETCREYGIDSRVIFTGPIRDREVLRSWNTRGDLFLFPSTYDTNGIVVREAAACALPSVLIRNSCAAEGITHGRNGYLIDENPESLAALLSEVCRDPDRMHEVGEHAMEEIYISWNDSVKNAYDRYGAVREMIADGSLKHREKHTSDYMIEYTADVAEIMKKIFDVPRNMTEGMLENVAEFREDLREGFHEIKEHIPEGVRHTIRKGLDLAEQSLGLGDK